MEIKTKHRIIGIIAIIALAVIIVPFFLNRSEKKDDSPALSSHVPNPPIKSVSQIPIADSTESVAPVSTSEQKPVPSATLTNQAYEPANTPPSATAEQIQAGANSNLATQALKPANAHPTHTSAITNTTVKAPNQTEAAEVNAPASVDTVKNVDQPIQNEALSPTKPHVIPRNKNGTVKVKLAEHHYLLQHFHHAAKQVAIADAWTIQLGSFGEKDNAEKLVKQLRKSGFTAYINRAKSGSNYVNRVFVGPELKRDHAEALNKKLQQAFKLKGVIVKYKV